MSSTGKKWLLGCGIGCAAHIVLSLGLAGGGLYLYKDTLFGWRDANRARTELLRSTADGRPFVPTWNAEALANRVDAFLMVQTSTSSPATVLVEILEDLRGTGRDAASAGARPARLWRGLRFVSRFGPRAADYVQIRARALLAAEMSQDEYFYLHSLIYHCWLEHDPASGIAELFTALRSADARFEFLSGDVVYDPDTDPQDAARYHRRQVAARHRDWLAAMLAAALEPPASRDWADAIGAQQSLLEVRSDAVPWRGSVPAAWAAVLEPRRAVLEANWLVERNLFELLAGF